MPPLWLVPVVLLLSACGGGGGGGGDSDSDSASAGPVLPDQLYEYVVELPEHFKVPAIPGSYYQPAVTYHDNTPLSSNPTTNEGATLGRVLFYDPNLSINRTISCASCHIQALGFSDDSIVSEGFEGGTTRRHSMGLTNARFNVSGKAFWDQRAATLEEQALMPIPDPVEMGLPLAHMEKRLAKLDYYPPLFEDAFGDSEITATRVGAALAQFLRSLVSFDSQYDQGRAQVDNFKDPFPNFTEEENRGKQLFLTPRQEGGGACVTCHSTEAFVNTNAGPTNNGLDEDTSFDEGVCEPLGFVDDLCGRFRVPSLRNIAVRPPFMHDGRFATLEEVIDHYSTNIQPHRNLNDVLFDEETNEPVRFNFTAEDKRALIAFLHTLTDPAMLSDEKFRDPFNPD